MPFRLTFKGVPFDMYTETERDEQIQDLLDRFQEDMAKLGVIVYQNESEKEEH